MRFPSINTSTPPHKVRDNAVSAVVVICLIGCYISLFALRGSLDIFEGTHYNYTFKHYVETNQYDYLAKALIEGKTTLDLPVADELRELENPYSFKERLTIADEDTPIFFDHAFYNGEYYSYFGVVPAVLLFVPYQLITNGHFLGTVNGIVVFGLFEIVFTSLLAIRIARVYFKRFATLTCQVLGVIMFFAGSNVVYLGFVPRDYSVPILASLGFSALALWLWIGSLSKRPRSAKSATYPSSWRLFLGSLAMALNLGCRPQFILASFLAFPIFWNLSINERKLFSKQSVKQTLCLLLPFAIVFAIIFFYNYMRFDSLYNFGAYYNLTGFDMTSYRQRWLDTLILIYNFLFRPISFTSGFPFVELSDIRLLGWAPIEPMFGGYFMLVPTTFLIFALPFIHKTLKQAQLGPFCILCLAISGVILLVDVRTAGITQRYFGDFGWCLSLVSIIAFYGLCAWISEREYSARLRLLKGLVAGTLVFSFVIGLLSLFSPQRFDTLSVTNPQLVDSVQGYFE